MSGHADALASLGVLVVDDEADVRELLVEYFRTKNFDVSRRRGRPGGAGRDPNASRPATASCSPTCSCPAPTASACCGRSSRRNPSAYVVIVTGYASLDSAIQAVRLGAYDYLTKPFSLGQIDVVLQRMRDRMALEAENRRLTRQVSQREGVDAADADPRPPRGDRGPAEPHRDAAARQRATRATASADAGAAGQPGPRPAIRVPTRDVG